MVVRAAKKSIEAHKKTRQLLTYSTSNPRFFSSFFDRYFQTYLTLHLAESCYYADVWELQEKDVKDGVCVTGSEKRNRIVDESNRTKF